MNRRSSRSKITLLLALCSLLTLSSCGKKEIGCLTDYQDFTGVPLSAELAPSIRSLCDMLAAPLSDTKGARDLALYSDLELRLQRTESREEAADTLFARWKREPDNFLWLELALNKSRYHGRHAAIDSMLAMPVLADTATAVGAFTFGRSDWGKGSRGEPFMKVEPLRSELDPFQQVWLDYYLALLESDQGHGLAGVRRLQNALPLAHGIGGCQLASRLWYRMRSLLQREDRLDDALYAAAATEALADKAGDDYHLMIARIKRAAILAARHESAAALGLLEECIREARERRFPYPLTKSLDDAASLCTELNDYERALDFDRRNLAIARAVRDSLNAPRAMITIAHDHRLLGNLDSSLVYQNEARRWVDAYPHPLNRAALPVKEAEYYCQIGDYAKVEALLAEATDQPAELGFVWDEAELLHGLILQGLDLGRPDIAYRAIGRMQELETALHDEQAHVNLRADLQIATADLLARQGEFRLAAEALDRALAAVNARGGEGKEWEYHRCRGDLALLREDFTSALDAYRRCLELAEEKGDAARLATSRFRLGHALLQDGRFDDAQDLFGDPKLDLSFGAQFRTRLSSLLFLGISHARQGNHAEALSWFRNIEELRTPHSPPDLMSRLEIERGLSLAATGHEQEALAALESAERLLRKTAGRSRTAELWAYHQSARRDLAEALIGLYLDHPGLTSGRDPVRVTLATAEQARRPAGAGTETSALSGGDWRELQRAGVSVLATFVGRDRSFLWIVAAEDATVHELPGRAALRDLLTPVVVDFGQPDRPIDATALARLSETLLGPLGDRWLEGSTLHIVADDLLHAVPWCALHVASGPEAATPALVIDRGPVIEAPSIEAILEPDRPRDPAGLRLLALGQDSAAGDGPAAGQLGSLRHAEAEAELIASLWPGSMASLMLGEQASWDPLLAADLPRPGVIHIASHAVVQQGLPDCSTLRLATGGASTPLTITEVGDLELDADLIYLSCCESARRLQSGGAGLADFASAFLNAGARTVVASTRMIEDEAAAQLAASFYRHWLEGKSKAASLRAAQLELRMSRPEWEHPFFWSSFRIIGDGG